MTKKTSGCITIVGAVIGIGGLLLLALSIIGMFTTEEAMDRNRELYAQWEQEMEAYYADSVKQVHYQEVCDRLDKAHEEGDSLLAAELESQLVELSPPEKEGNIGFNIAGAFLMIPALVGLLMAAIGVMLFIIGYMGGRKKKIDKV